LRHILRRWPQCFKPHRRRIRREIAGGGCECAPGRKDREKDPLLHHKVKTFETQRRIYDEVTVASTVLLDEQRAASEIVRCVEACPRHKRPVYIEVPHDIVDREIPITGIPLAAPEKSDPHTLEAALQKHSR
jgi:indolepyruvate decarboxylase